MNSALLTLALQAALSIVLALVALGLSGKVAAYSVLLGGLATVLPNAYLAARLAAPSLRNDAGRLLRTAWVGEIGKIMLTVAVFAVVFVAVKPLSAPALFGAFIATQLVTLGVLFYDARRAETSV
ncbi:MAG: ATP synthase subunit I [Pseudomonadota bacterium]